MNPLAGTAALAALALRRDRLLLPGWILVFAGTAAGSAAATKGVYPDLASQVKGAELVNATPGLLAMYGPIYDPTSLGAVSMFKLTAMGTAMVALFGLLVVIRHTRADEELGRTELLAAGVVGRAAPLAAALLVAAVGSAAIGAATAGALVATGLPAAGSLSFGLAWASAGLAFAGLGGVAAQLTSSARAARGIAVVTLAASYLARAAGDTAGDASGPGWLSLFSPIGWSQQIRPYTGDRWAWSLAGPGLLVLATLASFALLRRRDLGAGLLPQRRGPERAGGLLGSPLGLAWRLQRAAFAGWMVAFILLSLVAGQLIGTIGDMLDSPAARQLIVLMGGVDRLTDAFLSVELTFVAVFASAYGISAALRLPAEEASGRGDLLGATAVSRTRWALGHLVPAFAGTAALMLACGVTVGLAHAAQAGDPAALGRDLAAAAVRLPAAWVMVGVTVALYGIARKAAPFGWAALVAAMLVSEVGPLLDLPDWVRGLSPFSHVPPLPGGEITATPILVLTAVAAGLVRAGLAGLRRRDLSTG